MIDAYKKLKSQYNYLCSKSGLTPENMHGGSGSAKVNKDPLVHDQNILISPGNPYFTFAFAWFYHHYVFNWFSVPKRQTYPHSNVPT